MDALGIKTVTLPTLPTHTGQAAPILPKPASSDLPTLPQRQDGANFDVQIAEQKRFEAVRRRSQDIANVFIVSDRRFTIFKDTTGQYITRFTSLRDGRVTYIPEPQLFKLGGSGAEAAILNINA